MLTFKNVDREHLGKGRRNIQGRNDVNRWHVYASLSRFRYVNVSNVWSWILRSRSRSTTFIVLPVGGEYQPHIFTLVLIVSEMLRFEMFNLENLGPGYGVQHSQWFQPMANINIYKKRRWAFIALTVSQVLAFQILWPWKKEDQGHYVQHLQWQYMTSYLMAIVMFVLSVTIYEIFSRQIKCQKFDLENEGRIIEEKYVTWDIRLECPILGDFSKF